MGPPRGGTTPRGSLYSSPPPKYPRYTGQNVAIRRAFAILSAFAVLPRPRVEPSRLFDGNESRPREIRERGNVVSRLRGGGGFTGADSLSLARLGLREAPAVPEALVRANVTEYLGVHEANGVKLPNLYIALAANLEGSGREEAERLISAWEMDAAPGFITALIRVVGEPTADPKIRLLAGVVAKNAIGGSRERHSNTACWTHLPSQERSRLRGEIQRLLYLPETSTPLATQLTLMLAHISLHDYPRLWPDAMDEILEQGGVASRRILHSEDPPSLQSHLAAAEVKSRSLRAIKHVCRAQSQGRQGESSRVKSSVMRIMQQLIVDVNTPYDVSAVPRPSLSQAVSKVLSDWRASLDTFSKSTDPNLALAAGRVANRCLSALKEMLYVREASKLLEQLHPTLKGFIADALIYIEHLLGAMPSLTPEPGDERAELAIKGYERIVMCFRAIFEANPLECGPFLSRILQALLGSLFGETTNVQDMRWKLRNLLGKFLLDILDSHVFSPSVVQAYTNRHLRVEAALNQQIEALSDEGADEGVKGAREEVSRIGDEAAGRREGFEHISTLTGAVDGSLSESRTARLTYVIESTLAKYVALTPEELSEWQTDPEHYLETAGRDEPPQPDGETPRALGHALIRGFYQRAPTSTAKVLLNIQSRVRQMDTPQATLYREAAYRILGDFNTAPSIWKAYPADDLYIRDLRPILTLPEAQASLQSLVLTARAATLIGPIAMHLQIQTWLDAYAALSGLVGSSDRIIAVSAVSSLALMSAMLLKEQKIAMTEAENSRVERGEAALEAAKQGDEAKARDAAASAAKAERDALDTPTGHEILNKLSVVETNAEAILHRCFSLLDGLQEPYPISSVLGLVTRQIELLGPRVNKHIGVFAKSIPQAWLAARQRAEKAPPNSSLAKVGLTRIYGAITSLLTHLVARVGPTALSDSDLGPVLLSLLGHVLTANKEEDKDMEYVRDDALTLFETVQLAGGPAAARELSALLPAVSSAIEIEAPAPALAVIDGYLVYGMLDVLKPFLPTIISKIKTNILDLRDRLVIPQDEPPEIRRERPPRGLSSGSVRDLVSICGVVEKLIINDRTGEILTGDILEILQAMVQLLISLQNVSHRLIIPLHESLVETISRVLLISPNSLCRIAPGTQRQIQLIHALITIGSRVGFEEVIGSLISGSGLITGSSLAGLDSASSPASEGRARRHRTLVALSGIVNKGLIDYTKDIQVLKRIVNLGLRVLREEAERKKDLNSQTQKNVNLALSNTGPETAKGRHMKRKMLLARTDPVVSVDPHEPLRMAIRQVLAKLGWTESQLCEAFGWKGSFKPNLMAKLLRGETIYRRASRTNIIHSILGEEDHPFSGFLNVNGGQLETDPHGEPEIANADGPASQHEGPRIIIRTSNLPI
ncbi:hypothetical protein AAMO2058_000657100 [Amorphochlora amoebiformis]